MLAHRVISAFIVWDYALLLNSLENWTATHSLSSSNPVFSYLLAYYASITCLLYAMMSLLCRFMSLICRFYVTFMSLSNFITFWNIIKYIQFMSYVTRFCNFPQTLYWFSMVFKWKLNNFLTVFCQYFTIL